MVQRLDNVQIEGYKSIRSIELDVRPITVLAGANGAGKSNFLEVFDLIGQALNLELRTTVRRLGGANRLLHYGAKVTDEMLGTGHDVGYAIHRPPRRGS